MSKELWEYKLLTFGKVIIHSKFCKWIKVSEYWSKWTVEDCWHNQWTFDTVKQALDKVRELIAH